MGCVRERELSRISLWVESAVNQTWTAVGKADLWAVGGKEGKLRSSFCCFVGVRFEKSAKH